MYTDKKNILQLVALLEAHGITKVVLCPGSRNTPIVHTLSNHPNFTCYAVTDERSAGYFAIGLALNGGKPAAVCCTSGTALLNLHPAVAEAFYQNVPLVVISADRPAAWIGQMDGQTVPQPGVFQTLVKKSVNLPEIHTEEDEWYCNRLVNEALLETNHHGKGPVHINVPISEPLFQFTVDALPEVRVITRYQGLNVYDRDYNDLVDRMNKYQKRMIIIGQMNLIYLFEKRYIKLLYKHFAWLTEHIGNQTVPGIPVKNFDAALYAMPEEKIDQMVPELLITYGGHVVSKRLKKFLRQHPPKEHWHVSPEGEVVDLYGSLTTVIEMDPFEFLEKIASLLDNRTPEYPRVWENYCKIIPEPDFAYSEMAAVGALIKGLPESCALHLANSSVIRYAQLYSVPSTVEICCNRGTSGIEGSLSTAVGYAAASDKLKELGVKFKVVNVADLLSLQSAKENDEALTDEEFADIFTADKPVLFAYHSYAHDVRGLIYDRPNHDNFNVHGYEEEGSTTTPYDMVRVNRIDRYELTAEALRMIDADKYADKIDELEKFRDEAFQFAVDNGYDHPDYTDWVYSGVNTDKKGAVTATAATAGDNE